MITVTPDMLRRLDASALAAQKCEPDQNLKHFDHQLWRLIYKVGQTHPKEAGDMFGLSESTITLLCSRSESEIHKLASGALLSFTTRASAEQILAALAAEIEPSVYLENPNQHEADLAYWHLMARCGSKDALRTTETFGVDLAIVEGVVYSTDAHLRHLSQTVQEGFRLRFHENLIPDVLDDKMMSMAHIKRYATMLWGKQ